jgi:hypothetical protein
LGGLEVCAWWCCGCQIVEAYAFYSLMFATWLSGGHV